MNTEITKMDETGITFKQKVENSEMWKAAKAYCTSGMLPNGLNSPEKAFIAFNYLKSLGMDKSAISRVCVINGTPNIWGDLPLAIVQKSGKLESFKVTFVDKDYNELNIKNKNLHVPPYAAIFSAKRKDNGQEREDFFTMDEAKTAGLIDKKGSVWRKHPKDMLEARARAKVLKYLFSDVLNGASIAEYDFNVGPKFGNVEKQLENNIPKEIDLKSEFLERKEYVEREKDKSNHGKTDKKGSKKSK